MVMILFKSLSNTFSEWVKTSVKAVFFSNMLGFESVLFLCKNSNTDTLGLIIALSITDLIKSLSS